MGLARAAMGGGARADGASSDSEEDESAPLVVSPAGPSDRELDVPGRCVDELWDLFRLAVPIFISRVSSTLKAVTDTALLGHIDTDSRFLLASAMSDMWTQSTGVFMNGRVLGTFCSQAFGAGNKQLAGIWLQVSLCVVAVIAVPVGVLWAATEWVLHGVLGQPEQISSDAGYYAAVMLLGIPARLVFGQTSQFLQSQRIMRPAAQLSVLTCLLNLVVGWYCKPPRHRWHLGCILLKMPAISSLTGVLGFPGPLRSWGGGWGFVAMPIVTLFCEYVQCLVLILWFCWRKGLHRECWPEEGFSLSHVTAHRTAQYIRLYVPAAIVAASDWWRVAAIGAVAVTLGGKELAVFNTSCKSVSLESYMSCSHYISYHSSLSVVCNLSAGLSGVLAHRSSAVAGQHLQRRSLRQHGRQARHRPRRRPSKPSQAPLPHQRLPRRRRELPYRHAGVLVCA